ncbi:amino acid adenylation domain-containing protein [Micromonospora sp. NPDC049044]|uniref:non-ribosomal peptide synthetase n=1 Tax=unclassified Micromonospora TaxID=2617518 RepID=UPI003405FD4B
MTADEHSTAVMHFPASLAQQRFWFLQGLQPDSPVFNLTAALRLDGTLDEAALLGAVQDVVDRHEALRTAIVAEDGVPRQRVWASAPAPVTTVDLTGLVDAERERAVQAEIDAEAGRPFDLSAGPLARVRVLRTAPTERFLTLSAHHAVVDGWSMRVLLGDLSAAYRSRITGEGTLGEAPLQAGDVAVWERERLAGGAFAGQLERWRERLAGAACGIDLPMCGPREQVRRPAGGRVPVRLDARLTDALRTVAAERDATLFTVVLAGFRLLLHTYTGQDDLVIGCPTSGRARPELRDVVGGFGTVLPVRTQLPPGATIDDLLTVTRRATLAALADQDVPFEALVDATGAGGDLSRTPLFEALLSLLPRFDGVVDLPGVEATEVDWTNGSAQFDLALHLREEGDEMVGHLEHATARLPAGAATRMVGHLVRALEAVAGDPTRAITDVTLVSDAERERILALGQGEEAPFPDLRLEDLVSARAAADPGAVALRSQDGDLTYAELDAAARELAGRLAASGVGPESRVGVLAERSPGLVISILGVLHAGAAYVPLDPEYSDERLRYIVADAGCAVVLGDGRHTERAARLGAPAEAAAARSVPSDRSPDSLCYVMYTSGSTGRPKGVAVAHRGIVNRVAWGQRRWPLSVGDRVLHKTPFTFDVSVWELLWPLSAGATVVLARPGGHRDPAYLAALLADERITVAHFVPSMLRHFLEGGERRSFQALRRVFCSGEALSRDLVESFGRAVGVELHNLYGPTEASIEVSWWPCTTGEPDAPVPIGRPIQNAVLRVLDARRRVVPVGVRGELYIGGVPVARGYWGQPAMTAERFVSDPFGPPGSRLFRTGDWARWGEDGTLEFLGRTDDQVKLRGMRVEPGEVEATLRRHEDVADAAVAVVRQPSGHDALVAGVVARSAPSADLVDRLLASARRELPPYMVPWRVLVLPELPRTPSGKADGRALGELAAEQAARAAQAVSDSGPPTELEETLRRILTDVLLVDEPDVHANFFDLGGNSLLAMQVLSRVEGALGVRVTPQELFSAPTVAELALRVSAAGSAAGSIGPVRRADGPDPDEAERLLDRLDTLSDDEVEHLLRQMGTNDQ